MLNNEFVEKLYKKENELVRICNFHGIFDDKCNEIIQDLYIKLLIFKDIDRYLLNDEPNMYIIFQIIRNMIYDYRKGQQKRVFIELTDKIEVIDELYENEKYDFILNEVEKLEYWFDRNLMKLYIEQNHTIRSLSKDTKISANAIQKVFRKFKLRCKDEFKKSQNQF